ncbi:MAG: hypothetical protein ABEL51_15745 [Salinibacter sp.]
MTQDTSTTLELSVEEAAALGTALNVLAENRGMLPALGPDGITAMQSVSSLENVLARLDEAAPGLVPLPKDGVAWKERV